MKNNVVLLSIIMMLMFSCVSKNQPYVPENEYLIQGKLENVPDGTVIRLFQNGSVLYSDTVVGGEFTFRDTVSTLRTVSLNSRDEGFPTISREIWVKPGEYIYVSGQDRLLVTWQVKSNIAEQQEDNLYNEAIMPELKELMKLSAIRLSMQIQGFKRTDEEFIKHAKATTDSIRKLSTPLEEEITRKSLEYMKIAPMTERWMRELLEYVTAMEYEGYSQFKEDIKELYTRLSEDEKQTSLGKEITECILLAPVGIGDDMADGDLYDIDGKLRHISEFKGRYILLNFWAMGCAPCARSVPEMKEIVSLYKDKMTVICISDDSEQVWRKALKEQGMEGYQWNELRAKSILASRYGAGIIPYYVLIAPSGKVRDMWSGYGENSLIKRMNENIKR